ncbi:MAG: hypothetical protein KatS3mg047_1070 [Bellilinea sp.]|nr:MAG: hypothetical protein KatS3mg047_1070 [Bellilinea sp.]
MEVDMRWIMWIAEKHLCEIGKVLDEDIYEALRDLRKDESNSTKDNVFRAIKAYFTHRRNCSDCMVIWRKTSG